MHEPLPERAASLCAAGWRIELVGARYDALKRLKVGLNRTPHFRMSRRGDAIEAPTLLELIARAEEHTP